MNLVTKDIEDSFFPALDKVANELGASSVHMLSVMYSESGCSPKAHNDNPKNLEPEKRWNASGLIQFMPATLKALGYKGTHTDFRKLSATEQLPWVKKYYAPFQGQLKSIAALYVATFLPALTSKASDPKFVLTAKHGPLGFAYSPNAAFDTNKDYAITVQELEDAVSRNCKAERFAQLKARLTGEGLTPVTESSTIDLRTIRGMQQGLASLGFDPGVIDGIMGPKTSGAVLAFQTMHGLEADGIYGPLTRAMLAAKLPQEKPKKNAPAGPTD